MKTSFNISIGHIIVIFLIVVFSVIISVQVEIKMEERAVPTTSTDSVSCPEKLINLETYIIDHLINHHNFNGNDSADMYFLREKIKDIENGKVLDKSE